MRRSIRWLISVSLLGLVVGAWLLVSLLWPKADGRPSSTPTARPAPAQPAQPDKGEIPVSRELCEFVDRWLEARGLNRFGDPKDTVYAGGTPLFDEAGGPPRDRLELVMEKHPELHKEYLSRQETEGSSIDLWLEENGYGPWGERPAADGPAGSRPASEDRYLHVMRKVPHIAEEIGPPISIEARMWIDSWLEANDLNEFGDPRSTAYTDGTPCLDKKSGRLVNRYLRVLHQHPFLEVILEDMVAEEVDQ